MMSRNALHSLAALLILSSIGVSLYVATQSNLFQLKEVVVEPLSQGYPLRVDQVMDLANIPLGRWNLFSVDLTPVENRLKKNVWVRGVVISKEFPHTIKLKVIERKPIAMLNDSAGKVYYLEEDGTGFEDRNTLYSKALPILNGFPHQAEKLKPVMAWVQSWFRVPQMAEVNLSSISYDEKMGLKALVVYQNKIRVILELGMNTEEASKLPQARLIQVLDYLNDKALQASRIWLGDGKKIVVKVSGGP